MQAGCDAGRRRGRVAEQRRAGLKRRSGGSGTLLEQVVYGVCQALGQSVQAAGLLAAADQGWNQTVADRQERRQLTGGNVRGYVVAGAIQDGGVRRSVYRIG